MKISVRPLNKGEIFCCSMKSAKMVFKNTNVHLDFSYLGRDYATFAETPDSYYMKKRIKGRIVASFYAHSNTDNAILSFYVVKESDFSPNLKDEFESTYLLKLYDEYLQQIAKEYPSDRTKMMLVELYNGELFFHEDSF